MAAIETWAQANAKPGDSPGLVLGLHESRYRGVPVKLGTRPYTLWMVQRTLDVYRALSRHDRGVVDAALAGTGWESLPALEPCVRIAKKNNLLVWE